MLLDIKPILCGEKNRIDFSVSLAESDCGEIIGMFPDTVFAFPVTLSGEVKNAAGYITLCENAVFRFTAPCDRCAEPADAELDLSVEKCIASGADSGDSDDYIFAKDKKLDITAVIFEELVLGMPSKILCREDCLGLCPGCGKNLNKEACVCQKPEGDPRLAILKTLLKK